MWISVKDRVPNNDRWVFVTGKGKMEKQSIPFVSYYSVRSNIFCNEEYERNRSFIDASFEITHWMEIPTLPEEYYTNDLDHGKIKDWSL